MQIFKNDFLMSIGVSTCLFLGNSAMLLAWTQGQPISDGPSSLNPTPSCLAIDHNSNTTVGWLGGVIGTDNSLFTASLPAEAPNWNAPILLYSGTPPQFSSFPEIFADNNGKVNSIWANFLFDKDVANATIILNSTQDSLDFSWPTPIASDELIGFPNGGDIGVDKLGNKVGILALTANSESSFPPFSIMLVAMANGATSWTSPVVLGTDNSSNSPVVFVSASEGQALLGWRETPLSFKSARYNFATEELSAINNLYLPAGTTDIGFAKAVVAASGDATAVFGVRIGLATNYVIYSAFLPKGSSTWTFPEPVSNPDHDTTNLYLSIKTDDAENTKILWGELNASNNGFIRAASLPFGGAITDIQDLTDPNPSVSTTGGEGSGLLLDLDDFGNQVAIWQLYIDSVPTVQVASKANEGSWTTVENLSSTGLTPKVCLSNQGTSVAVWVDSVTHLLNASTSNYLFPLSAPTLFGGYISEEDSGFALNFHWNPSLAPNVVNYEIFNGTRLVASISGEGPFSYQQMLDCDSIDGIYTLVAVGSNGNKSEPLALVFFE